jgi:hypothetical protein
LAVRETDYLLRRVLLNQALLLKALHVLVRFCPDGITHEGLAAGKALEDAADETMKLVKEGALR